MKIKMNMFVAQILWASLFAMSAFTVAHSHELSGNRVTMVLRDETHIALTFYVDYPNVLYQLLVPAKTQRSQREFLLAYSAMKPEEFRQQVLRAQSRLQAETSARLNDGTDVVITGWVWPDPARMQTLIQHEVMESMVGGDARANKNANGNAPATATATATAHAHAHESPTEIRANISHDTPIKSATIQFAEAFGKMLLVSYRPQQVWVAPKQASTLIKF